MNSNEERGTNVDVDADIARMSTSTPAQIITVPDSSPEGLMERFQRQQAMEQVQAKQELEKLEKNSYRETAPQVVRTIPNAVATPPPPKQPVYREEQEPIANPVSLRARINEMESKLGTTNSMPLTGKTYNAQSYLDDLGDETFFVHNVSNGHVLVTDLELKIPRGAILDLLKFCDLETIKKSRDIRVALSANPRNGAMIIRLTPEQYLVKMDQAYKEQEKIENFKKVAALRALSGQAEDNKYMEPIRPVVYDKLNKLKLSYSDTPHKGITPVEFAQWVQTEDLTKAELDQILAQIDDNELRILVNERKKLLLERM